MIFDSAIESVADYITELSLPWGILTHSRDWSFLLSAVSLNPENESRANMEAGLGPRHRFYVVTDGLVLGEALQPAFVIHASLSVLRMAAFDLQEERETVNEIVTGV
ncbi:hypothetical protein HYDPIDRAFT_108530 [Hydnomerulius pinastri MD-312]|nr:hypothetical protein HYDPIDRAFT_108530 [Hydnomerulius pinastri MD-312]